MSLSLTPARDELDRSNELFQFLQGKLPKGTKVTRSHVPKLTPDQAWIVIWYLGNEHWEVPDYIERCGLCGDLYNSNLEGACLDYGKAPYSFCEGCRETETYRKKNRRNPDKVMRDAQR